MARRRIRDKIRFEHRVQETKRNAYNHGKPWTDDEVAVVMEGIYNDRTIYDMAMELGRSYYAVAAARTNTRWAMNHSRVIYVKSSRPKHLRRAQ